MLYIADDGYLNPLEISLVFPDGVQIKQRLGWVGMPAITAVDNTGSGVSGGDVGSSRMGVAYDNYLGPQSFKRAHGVNQALAFGDAADRGG